jgi:colanic acid/amylovoran biosynthesis protein
LKFRHAKPRRTLDGKKVRARIVLYGYYRHNLGDDMFFDMLFRRYPDVMFYILFEPDYAEFFSHYPNVRFYESTRPLVAKINALGRKLHKDNFFERLLIRLCDGAMHIGGSIYQQVGNWQFDFDIRKKRKLFGRKFFAISNNFGPYSTDAYRDMWAKEFKKWTDICFRDEYSYKLFRDIPTVRYAPDLLFGYPIEQKETEKKVAVSLIDAFLDGRPFDKSTAEAYGNTLTEMIKRFVSDGYRVSLLSFCEFEQDAVAADRIMSALPEETAKSVKSIVYRQSIGEAVGEIETAEYVIASRFHAMVLGYIAGKKVLPLCYSKKTSNVLTDLKLSDSPIMLEDISNFTADELVSRANAITEERKNELCEMSKQQFAGFDKFVKKHRGEIRE